MLESDRRWVYFYDLKLESYPKEAPRFEMAKVVKNVHGAFRNGPITWSYRNSEVTVRIADMKVSDEFTSILVHLADIKASDPAFSNVVTGNVRVEEKQNNEGIGVGCHIVIQNTAYNEQSNSYLTIVEEVRGISKTIIQSFLANVLRNHSSEEYTVTNKKEKAKKCRPKPHLAAHGSKTLKESLENGALTGIVLLDNKAGEVFDDDDELTLNGRQMKIKVTSAPTGNKALDILQKVKEKYATDYDQLRFTYSEKVGTRKVKNPGAAEKKKDVKRQRNMQFETKLKNFAEQLFSKSELVVLKDDIGQCERSVHIGLNNAMKRLIKEAAT